jgi:exopolyphosphatase/pppGpp-phosphohydrolase
MTKKAETYDRYYADGLSAKTSDIDKQIEKIFKSSLLELEQNIYIGENRAPIIVAACLIFQTIYKTLQIKDLISSLKNAQDAIIMDLIGKGVTKND